MAFAQVWLGLIAGNSKLHWAEFESDRDAGFRKNRLVATWDSPHLLEPLLGLGEIPPPPLCERGAWRQEAEKQEAREREEAPKLLYFASVVPEQGERIRAYTQAKEITLADIPLGNLYPTLGVDRALALLGAGDRYGYPVLVIDGGTAITLTGADCDRTLVGGAILPGLQLQFDSLGIGTAALPRLNIGPDSTKPSGAELPERWALNTEGAIASGILHNLASGIRAFASDWLELYPSSTIVTTGGSGPWLAAQLVALPQVTEPVPDLGLYGILAWRQQQQELAS